MLHSSAISHPYFLPLSPPYLFSACCIFLGFYRVDVQSENLKNFSKKNIISTILKEPQ